MALLYLVMQLVQHVSTRSLVRSYRRSDAVKLLFRAMPVCEP